MANEQITFDKLPQAVGYLTEQMEQILFVEVLTQADKSKVIASLWFALRSMYYLRCLFLK